MAALFAEFCMMTRTLLLGLLLLAGRLGGA
jgi:hypothetical protein